MDGAGASAFSLGSTVIDTVGGQQQTAQAETAGGQTDTNGGSRWSSRDGRVWNFPCGSDTDQLYALRSVTETPQPFAAPPPLFCPGPEVLQRVAECRVLVVGAGGLGGRTPRNRKREEHVGQPKAMVAAQELNERFRHLGVQIEAHCCKLQEKPLSFFRGFDVVIGGLDCVETRRWLNGRMHELVERDSTGAVIMETAPLLLDGGTEGLRGQMRLCIPGVTACYECGIGTLAPQVTYPLCTIASTPRQPEHCVEYCLVVQWVKDHPDQQIDLENPDHLAWLFEASKARAERFGIQGVTYRLTTGVSKDCLVCSRRQMQLRVDGAWTLLRLLEELQKQAHLNKPSMRSSKDFIFIQNPPSIRSQHEWKLDLSLMELIERGCINEGEPIFVTDPSLAFPIELSLVFSGAMPDDS